MNRRQFLAGAAAAPFALHHVVARADGRARALALVTADTEAHVVAVDPHAGRVSWRLATVAGPRSIESVARRAAVVAHTTEGRVSLLGARPLGVRRVLRGFSEPRYTAARRDGRHVYVTDSKLGEVATIDMQAGRVIRRTAVGELARHVSLAPEGRTLWVALGSKARLVAALDVTDATRPRLLGTARPPFLAHDVGFSPEGRWVWATPGDRRPVAIHDRATRRFRARLRAGAPPQHVTFLGGTACVTSGDDGSFRVHDVATGRLLRTTPVPAGSYNVQQGFELVLTPSLDEGTVCVLGPRGDLRHELRVARSSHDACLVVA